MLVQQNTKGHSFQQWSESNINNKYHEQPAIIMENKRPQLPCWRKSEWGPNCPPAVVVPFSGGTTGALQVGQVCCRSNHDRRQCIWKRCPQISFLAVTISSRQIMQVASLLHANRNHQKHAITTESVVIKQSMDQVLTHQVLQVLHLENDHSYLKSSSYNEWNQKYGSWSYRMFHRAPESSAKAHHSS